MRSAKLILAIVLLCAVWPGASASADGIVLVTGTVSPHERQIVVDTFQATAKALTWQLTAPTLGRDALAASVRCLSDAAPWTCIAPEIRSHDQIVIIQFESDRGSGAPMIVATAHVLISGIQSDVSATRYCETGNEEGFKRATGDLSKVMQDAAERTGRTTLVIRSKPDKAWITLDGKNVGATERTRATYPGLHTVSVRRIGYKAIARDVVAIEGKATTVEFQLEPDGSPAAPDDHDHPVVSTPSSRLTPKLAVGAGGVAIGAGIVWLAINGKPDIHGPQSPQYHDTARYGYPALAIGAVAASVGLYFWLRPDATSAATVAPVHGGAAAGWAWRF